MIIVDYSYDFAKIKETYPEKIGLEQMRVICHISKKTARYLLKSGLVPCIVHYQHKGCYCLPKKAPIQPAKIYTPNRLLLGKLEQGKPKENPYATGMGQS